MGFLPFDGGASGQTTIKGVDGFAASRFVSAERYRDLDRRQSYYDCTQHDHCRFDFEGRMRRPGPPTSQALLSQEAAPWYIPLAQRRPSAPYRLARAIVDSFTSLVFGEQRWPTIRIAADEDSQAFAEALSKAASLPTTMIRARNMGGSTGSVGLSWCYRRGVPRVQVHNPKHLHVEEWEDREGLLPAKVVEAYIYPADAMDPQKGKVTRQLFWYRRDWTEDADVAYKEVKYEPGKDPQWQVDPQASVKHGRGKPRITWVQNLPSDEEDGLPDYDGLYDNFDAIDILLSVINRGAVLNLDPTVVLKMDRDIVSRMGVKKGSDNALVVGPDGDAHYMELGGSSIDAGVKLFETKRRAILEVAQCVLPDPNEIAASGMSSVAMKVVYAPMLQRGELFREQYGRPIKWLLTELSDAARQASGRGPTSVQVPEQVEGEP